MSSNLDQLTADAMKLPLRHRVQLAQRLVSTLDGDEAESGAEELWFVEVERRLEELRSGKSRASKAGDRSGESESSRQKAVSS